MQTSSADYKTAIAATERDIRGYIKFNNTYTMSGADGLISFKTTQNAMDAERFCVGSTTSCFCEATFYNSGLEGSGVSLANSYFDAYIGVVTDAANDTVEYICCGRYWVSEITRGKETTKIVGYDVAGRLSMDYVPTVTADPDDGYLVMDVLNDIISQTGVNGSTPFTTYGDSTYVPNIYEGNCRAQWGWLCSLVDGTASNYSGTREPADLGYIKTYVAGNGVATPYAVDETTTYMDGLSLGDAYTITSFTSGTTDEPIVVGNGTGLYGLNPYMTTAVATTIEGTMDNYQYYPATLHWRGDPCLDILDEINVTKGADTYKIVVMKIETTFNGGLEQTITSFGDSEAYYALSTSPTQGAINRVSNLVQEMQQAIETADNGVCTKILDTDGTWKEFVIANNQDLSQATSVWRFNINGLAHSDRYSGGTYTLAMDTQGRIVANVIQTGILQDAQGNNSWNLDTGALTITNGSINITTTSQDDDVIQFQYNELKNKFSPLEYKIINTTTQRATIVQATGMWVYNNYVDDAHRTLRSTIQNGSLWQYDTNGKKRGYFEFGDIYLYDSTELLRQHLNSDGGLWQYDASGVLRQRLFGDGTLRQYDTSGKKRTYLEYGDIFLYNASETQTLKLSGSAFPAIGGSLQLYDTSANERTRLTADGLDFYNASGTLTASYPPAGLPMLSAASAANTDYLEGKVINVGLLTYTQLGIGSSASIADTVSAWLKYVCAHYTNAFRCIFEGTLTMDSSRMMRYYIYHTQTVNSNGVPQYASGQMQNYDGRIWISGTNNYAVYSKLLYDYITEYGNSNGWYWRKWAGGTVEMWKRLNVSIAVTSSWGNVYYGAVPRQTYPLTLNSSPWEIVSVTGSGGWAWIGCGDSTPSATQSGTYYLFRPSSATVTFNIDFYVRGGL